MYLHIQNNEWRIFPIALGVWGFLGILLLIGVCLGHTPLRCVQIFWQYVQGTFEGNTLFGTVFFGAIIGGLFLLIPAGIISYIRWRTAVREFCPVRAIDFDLAGVKLHQADGIVFLPYSETAFTLQVYLSALELFFQKNVKMVFKFVCEGRIFEVPHIERKSFLLNLHEAVDWYQFASCTYQVRASRWASQSIVNKAKQLQQLLIHQYEHNTSITSLTKPSYAMLWYFPLLAGGLGWMHTVMKHATFPNWGELIVVVMVGEVWLGRYIYHQRRKFDEQMKH